MINMNKLLFFNTLVFSILMSISSYSWFSMWMGLEINLLSIVPLMTSKLPLSSESSLKYFLTQAMASSLFLYSAVMMSLEIHSNFNMMMYIMNIALLIKMAAAPFHFWFPEIMEGLAWSPCLLLLTVQKLPPMMLLMTNLISINFLTLIIISSMLIGGIMGLNHVSLRKIMTYSSINHIGWLLASLTLNSMIWLTYFIIYTTITLLMVMFFHEKNIFFINQLFQNSKFSNMEKLMFAFNFMSLGGLPPFIGFYPKWIVINNMVSTHMILISLAMVIVTLITLYYYIRIMNFYMLMNTSEMSFSINTKLNKFFMMFMFLNITGLMILMTMW
uniref:NADH-ubiquinone oxidoreductase chain 2 n=1 Tax=Bostrichoidea sp. 6 KM-2017 TaxID=2219280 RepID=A0A346RKE4_9COLE|nr:NADH dehydrogenase subunit 2 [Bostrichoidea sp. 6 KM-2017]